MQGVGWIGAIILGGIAGWIAERVMGSSMGIIANVILGIVGAIVLNAILAWLNVVPSDGWLAQLVIGVIGAIILIWPKRPSAAAPDSLRAGSLSESRRLGAAMCVCWDDLTRAAWATRAI